MSVDCYYAMVITNGGERLKSDVLAIVGLVARLTTHSPALRRQLHLYADESDFRRFSD